MDSNIRTDRLSDLPSCLTLSILSLLETRDAVTTTFLSKRWNNLWTAAPSMSFRDENREFIHGALARWKGAKLTKLTILFNAAADHWYVCPSGDIDSWLYFAMAAQVEELHMDLANWKSDTGATYSPPQLFYSCPSLTKLTLCDFHLKIEGDVRWSRLKSLTIEIETWVPLSEEPLGRILSGAPLLEELYLRVPEISESFSIRSTSLKKLKMIRTDWDGYSAVKAVLRIWAPNLLKLVISEFFYGSCFLDVPSLASVRFSFEPCDYDLTIDGRYEMFHQLLQSIYPVHKVTLSDWFDQLIMKMKKKGMVVRFAHTSSC